MKAQAKIKYLRVTARKMRPVCNVVRGKGVQQAIDFLTHCRRKAARPLLKLVKSALSNAERKGGVDVDRLFISKLCCDQGPSMKRWLPRARGMASPILKRSCHVEVALDER